MGHVSHMVSSFQCLPLLPFCTISRLPQVDMRKRGLASHSLEGSQRVLGVRSGESWDSIPNRSQETRPLKLLRSLRAIPCLKSLEHLISHKCAHGVPVPHGTDSIGEGENLPRDLIDHLSPAGPALPTHNPHIRVVQRAQLAPHRPVEGVHAPELGSEQNQAEP